MRFLVAFWMFSCAPIWAVGPVTPSQSNCEIWASELIPQIEEILGRRFKHKPVIHVLKIERARELFREQVEAELAAGRPSEDFSKLPEEAFGVFNNIDGKIYIFGTSLEAQVPESLQGVERIPFFKIALSHFLVGAMYLQHYPMNLQAEPNLLRKMIRNGIRRGLEYAVAKILAENYRATPTHLSHLSGNFGDINFQLISLGADFLSRLLAQGGPEAVWRTVENPPRNLESFQGAPKPAKLVAMLDELLPLLEDKSVYARYQIHDHTSLSADGLASVKRMIQIDLVSYHGLPKASFQWAEVESEDKALEFARELAPEVEAEKSCVKQLNGGLERLVSVRGSHILLLTENKTFLPGTVEQVGGLLWKYFADF
ncbi:hypothetical protein K2X33_16725 [bacterium]|nr:hypothetical protein [bacterium]